MNATNRSGWHRTNPKATPMDDRYEWIPVIHETCNGQGCRDCGFTGELTVRINLDEVAA